MKQLKIINSEGATEEEIKDYKLREATRAVVVDNEGMIALLYVSKNDYYKLPGGGIESGEDKIEALKRECLEEIGCDIDVMNEVGSIVEYRKFSNLKQISYCYFAKIKGEKGIPELTENEINNGFKQVWLSYDEIKEIFSKNEAKTIEGKEYIVPRDKVFIEEVKVYLNTINK